MIERWNSEIDTYLVYAGLFSAIVTAFNVQSYSSLQQKPDPALAAVLQISLQLSSLSVNPPFVNPTHPAFGSADAASAGPALVPPPDAATVALNALWFSSLVLSLSSASIGIMVKQWLNEYKSGLSSGSQKTSLETRETPYSARLRQYRLNNLVKWRVDVVVLAIPILLQLALAFFLAGLLVLAWTLHHAGAAITTFLVTVLVTFSLATVVLPSVKSSCAYLSPQALVVDATFQIMRRIFCRVLHGLVAPIRTCARRLVDGESNTVVPRKAAELVRDVTGSVLLWCRNSGQDRNAPLRTWRTREKEAIALSGESLDLDMLATAYDTSLADPKILDAAAKCLTDASKMSVIWAFDRFHAVATKHFGPTFTALNLVVSARPASFDLWWNAMLSMLASPVTMSTRDKLKDYLGYIRFSRQSLPAGAHADWILCGLSAAIWNESSNLQTIYGASDSARKVHGLVTVLQGLLVVDGRIGTKTIRYGE
ncbi:hypothetical protein BV20DRAFT_958417 [Pilatotrama ljubarskyi]|nr:hypothetical protein BV20DRAFT_958417 [Pilatotrama ljubarskyi]